MISKQDFKGLSMAYLGCFILSGYMIIDYYHYNSFVYFFEWGVVWTGVFFFALLGLLCGGKFISKRLKLNIL